MVQPISFFLSDVRNNLDTSDQFINPVGYLQGALLLGPDSPAKIFLENVQSCLAGVPEAPTMEMSGWETFTFTPEDQATIQACSAHLAAIEAGTAYRPTDLPLTENVITELRVTLPVNNADLVQRLKTKHPSQADTIQAVVNYFNNATHGGNVEVALAVGAASLSDKTKVTLTTLFPVLSAESTQREIQRLKTENPSEAGAIDEAVACYRRTGDMGGCLEGSGEPLFNPQEQGGVAGFLTDYFATSHLLAPLLVYSDEALGYIPSTIVGDTVPPGLIGTIVLTIPGPPGFGNLLSFDGEELAEQPRRQKWVRFAETSALTVHAAGLFVTALSERPNGGVDEGVLRDEEHDAGPLNVANYQTLANKTIGFARLASLEASRIWHFNGETEPNFSLYYGVGLGWTTQFGIVLNSSVENNVQEDIYYNDRLQMGETGITVGIGGGQGPGIGNGQTLYESVIPGMTGAVQNTALLQAESYSRLDVNQRTWEIGHKTGKPGLYAIGPAGNAVFYGLRLAGPDIWQEDPIPFFDHGHPTVRFWDGLASGVNLGATTAIPLIAEGDLWYNGTLGMTAGRLENTMRLYPTTLIGDTATQGLYGRGEVGKSVMDAPLYGLVGTLVFNNLSTGTQGAFSAMRNARHPGDPRNKVDFWANIGIDGTNLAFSTVYAFDEDNHLETADKWLIIGSAIAGPVVRLGTQGITTAALKPRGSQAHFVASNSERGSRPLVAPTVGLLPDGGTFGLTGTW